MIRKVLLIPILAASFMLNACTGPGDPVDIQVNLPAYKTYAAEELHIHTHDRTWPEWMSATDKLALDYITVGRTDATTQAAIAEAERACRIYTKATRPSDAVAVIMNGTLYAVVSAPFMALGATAFPGADAVQYAEYGASAAAGGGAANGIVQLGGKQYTFQNCGRGIFEQAKQFPVVILERAPY